MVVVVVVVVVVVGCGLVINTQKNVVEGTYSGLTDDRLQKFVSYNMAYVIQ
jgi:hypothetical protein